MPKKIKSVIYPNSPLVEVVFELRFSGHPVVECRRDIFFDYIQKDYPKIYVPRIKEKSFVALEPYNFEKEDRSSGIILSINRFSFFCRKYNGFKEFEKEFLRLISFFKKSYPKIGTLNRVGFRYINMIPFVREDGVVPIERFLNVKLQTPTIIPDKFNNISIGFISKINEGTITTRIENLKEGNNREVILLDIDYAKEGKFSIINIKKLLNESHKSSRLLFEELITDSYRMFLKGETI